MPFGYECRARLLKQVPHKPTFRTASLSRPTPGPDSYEQPPICGGKGFSKLKRAPAYTFGRVLNDNFTPPVKPNAPILNVTGTNYKKGVNKIPGGWMGSYNEVSGSKGKTPGPGTYEPLLTVKVKRAPAYTMRHAYKAPYEPHDMWTPPPNMYYPPIPRKRPPAYSFRSKGLVLKPFEMPGPGAHNPNPEYVLKKKPEYSLGPGYRPCQALVTPAPNTYCEKKFMVIKPTTPAPSFGIKHSPYLGKPKILLKPSGIELRAQARY